jgi:5-methyltetrahydropteroyltriglutamate--homocysteine methyltransferase
MTPALRSTDRILTTHVGSLVRPDDFVSAMKHRRAGEGMSDTDFNALLSRSVDDVVRRQAEVGIDLVSDGEFGKTISWSRYVLERL